MSDGSKNMQTMYKKQHPKETANIISRIFFCWTLPTFIKGFKKEFDEGDLYGPLKEHKSCLLGDKLEKAWNEEVNKPKPSLSRAIFRVFALDIIWTGLVLVFIESLKFSQPICLGILITYYIPNQTTVTKEEAYISASFIVMISLCNALLGHWYMLYLQHLGMKMRVSCSALIYRKSLKLNKTALSKTTIGQLVNLLSNDVSRFDYGMNHFHGLWSGPLATLIILGFLYYQVGVAGIAGLIFLILFIPFQMYLGKKSSQYRLKTALKTDERVHLMNEIISGIQVIKMYTWEKPFAKLVETARKREIKLIRVSSHIKAILLSLVMFNGRLAIFLTVLTYVLMGEIPDAKFVFVVTAFYNVIRQNLVKNFPRAITQTAEALISVGRLKKFLQYDEVHVKSPDESSPDSAIGVNLVGVTANWGNTERTLSNISVSMNNHQVTAIVGEVGSGKTTLLHVILKELPTIEGAVTVNGRISYASQEPWLFSGTIKENILFGQPLNIKRYREVIKSCDLERDFSVFTFGDNTTVGEKGVTLSGGQRARISLARALYREADIYLLDDPLSAVDAHVGKHLFEEAICGFLHEKCTVLVTHQLQFLGNVDQIVVLENGEVAAIGSYQELLTSGKDFTKMLSNGESNKEERGVRNDTESKGSVHKNEVKESGPAQNKETRSAGNISKKVYKAYMKAGGRYCYSFLLLSTFVLAQASASGADYFMSFWVNKEEERTRNNNTTPQNGFFTTENSVYVYSSIVAVVVIISLTRSVSFFKYCMRASTNLHNNMFNKIVYGKMSFFNTNPSGRILNRFSKDMGTIDEILPSVIVDTLQNGLSVLGICVVIAIVNFWSLIPTFIIFILFYLLRVVYLATSRSVKRLEGTTKSPVFTHLNATLQGLTTIRAFNAQDFLKVEFDNHQDLHSSAFYLFLGCTRTFGFWIDFLCVIYIGLVTMSFLLMGTETHGGNVGLAITQAIGLTGMLQWGMRQWSELENQMTSVERVVEYTEIEHEVDRGTKQPPDSWPGNGSVEFKNVSLRYSQRDHHVLKNINFKVHGGEKIGIVGRSGAGKSSLIIALFQIAETEGDIIIDGLNIKEVPLMVTRSKISIIPQEPVLFTGTLRKNLDPFDEYKDEEIWKALEEVELKNLATDLPSGLNSKITESGSNLSVGQRQLLCLARAILRKNKILVLDEATANVDPKTDFFIQKTIREKFAECTVLTIAHRLHTVIDSDRILVMDNGKVASFDQPYVLLCDKEGVFFKLVEQTGEAMANSLLEMAKNGKKWR